ncbi:hypothetical protein Pan216_24330 [Planctomycetes bacterium Pan216]|uniref:DUF4240 domain-containing protein n=1 Tax=Kolteria novifilia TaxID=2527975 RepID=A0A518B3Q9_9BACT|nr:hypothetical protein Pan216_24330 [Planctomycetes bacterium Pan216]
MSAFDRDSTAAMNHLVQERTRNGETLGKDFTLSDALHLAIQRTFEKYLVESRFVQLSDGLREIDDIDKNQQNGVNLRQSQRIERLARVLRANGELLLLRRFWFGLAKDRVRQFFESLPTKHELQQMSSEERLLHERYAEFYKYGAETAIHEYLVLVDSDPESTERLRGESLLESVRRKRKPKSRFPADRRKMSEEVFWDVISTCREQAEEDEDYPGLLEEKLESFGKRSIVSFQNILSERMSKLYRQDLWAIASIISGGFCSDDGFEYFRAWIISQGSEAYQRWLDAPEKAAETIEPSENVECELLLYAAPEAYSSKGGGDIDEHLREVPLDLVGEPWQEEDLPKLYPQLWKRFVKKK